jgi:hypothetical protein
MNSWVRIIEVIWTVPVLLIIAFVASLANV